MRFLVFLFGLPKCTARNTAVKRFVGKTTEVEGVEHKELTHLELMDTQESGATRGKRGGKLWSMRIRSERMATWMGFVGFSCVGRSMLMCSTNLVGAVLVFPRCFLEFLQKAKACSKFF